MAAGASSPGGSKQLEVGSLYEVVLLLFIRDNARSRAASPYAACTELEQTSAGSPNATRYAITSSHLRVRLKQLQNPASCRLMRWSTVEKTSWAALAKVGIEVVVIADNPQPGLNVYECVEEHRDALASCTYGKSRLTSSGAYVTQFKAVQRRDHAGRIFNQCSTPCPRSIHARRSLAMC